MLVDVFEQDLHSVNNYSSALTHEQHCSPAYGNYLKNYLVPSPGDWPSWYYVKKILVSAPDDSPLLSLIPEQGPFHVTLNAHETAVTMHRFFFHSYINIYLILLYQRSQN